jgi:hypothetical protein
MSFESAKSINKGKNMVRLSETQRYEFATSIIIKAGELASSYFSDLSKLVIEKKGIRT